ncbi:MAG: hypothetical protein OXI60_11610 [Acidiferrobacterales bacterium]|nr:hypothetical protein [Acidiferrobacterales bacterium]
MMTGSFTDWAGTIAEIGPIYPFVGTEWLLVLAGVVFWVAWHACQLSRETSNLKEEDKHHRSGGG